MIFKRKILMNLIIMFLILGLVLFSLPPFTPLSSLAAGNVYYVAKNGSDSNPGTEAQPWLTIQKAANTLIAGDTVYVKAGTYNERVIPKNSGTSGNLITYETYPGDTVVMYGFDITKNYIKVKGFEVANNPSDDGIAVNANSVEILNNYVHHTARSNIGINGGSYNIVRNNTLSYAGDNGMDIYGEHNIIEYNEISYPRDNIANVGGNGNIIRYNYGHHAWNRGLPGQTDHIAGFYLVGATNTLFDGNLLHDIQTYFFELKSSGGANIENITIQNNIMYKNDNYGILLEDVAPNVVRNIKIFNNVITETKYSAILAAFISATANIQIFNNIFYNAGAYPQIQAITADYNLIYPDYGGSPNEMHGLKTDPKFIDPINRNYRLSTSSPAIDAGTSDGAPTTDKNGNPRYDDPNTSNKGGGTYSYYDIGAYEYQGTGGSPPSDTTPPTVSILFPPNGSTVSGATVNITASASDNTEVTKVDFYIDAQLKSTDTSSPYSYTWDTTGYSNGSHTLMVKAYDPAGNSSSATRTVTVSNQTPDTGSGGDSSSPAPSGGGGSSGGGGGGGSAPAPAPPSGDSGGALPSGVITGRIIDVAGKPVVGTTVKVGDLTTTSGLNGEFAVRAPAGVVIVYYTASGYQGQTQVLPVAPNGTITPPTVVLSGDTGEILGRVINSSGETIPGTVIRINASLMSTNPGGEFRFTQVYPGIYTIYYDAPGYIGQTQVFQVLGGIENRPPTVILSPTPESQIGPSHKTRNNGRRWRWRRVRRR